MGGGANLNKNASLVKLAVSSEDMAAVACYDDKNEDIGSVLKKMGLTFEPKALQLLYSRLSGDRMVNLGELEKLSVYMGNAKNVTVGVIQKVISNVSDSNVDDIYYAALEGNKEEALACYTAYINEGNEPVSVVRSMTYHLFRLLICCAAMENGDTIDKAMGKLVPRVFWAQEDAFKRQLELWNREKLFRAFEILYDAEKDCKTTNMPADKIVSMMLLRVAGAAKR